MKIGEIVEQSSRLLALIGGCVLLMIITITCISIFGRAFINLGLSPIPGDFELVEAGVAFTVFSFLPWCQINGGHATVDVFTNRLPTVINHWINFISETLMAIAYIVITWKLSDGMFTRIRYNDTTFILEFPIWWAYAACLAASTIACIVTLYTAANSFVEAWTFSSSQTTSTGDKQ